MNLENWGWNHSHAAVLATLAPDLVPGRVVWENRGFVRVQTEAGQLTARLRPAVSERPVTGDWVALDPAHGVVSDVLQRRTSISRKKAGRDFAQQVLCANVDVLFIVTGLDGDFNPRRLERYLLVAREGGAAPVIVLNKSDLCDDPAPALRAADRVVGAAPVVLMSALDRDCAGLLGCHVEPRQTAALVGSSGVGKSTIVNRLLDAERQAVAPVRSSDHRGRHTTSTRELFLLDAGWLLIDTPGLRELEPWAAPESVASVYEDIQALAASCRFRDCGHAGEPDCAVAVAIENGALDAARLAGFHKMQGEIAYSRRMADARAALEYKRNVKRMHRAYRKSMRE